MTQACCRNEQDVLLLRDNTNGPPAVTLLKSLQLSRVCPRASTILAQAALSHKQASLESIITHLKATKIVAAELINSSTRPDVDVLFLSMYPATSASQAKLQVLLHTQAFQERAGDGSEPAHIFLSAQLSICSAADESMEIMMNILVSLPQLKNFHPPVHQLSKPPHSTSFTTWITNS